MSGQPEAITRSSVAPVSVPAVTSPARAPAKPPATPTGPSAPVSDAAVQAALDSVAPFWKEAHAVLQAYPSAALARAMLEGAVPLIAAERAEQAEARLAEVRQCCQEAAGIADLIVHSGGKPITASPLIDAILAIIGTGEEPS